jgi:ketosteroid isomerase-like protein
MISNRWLTLLFLLLVSFLIANASEEVYRDTRVEAELKALVQQWDNALVKHDAVALGNLLAPEFTLSGLPKAAYLNYVRSTRNSTVSATSGEFDVRVYGDTAILVAIDKIKFRKDGAETTEWYRYIDVWVKREGRWLCVITESSQVKKPQKG